MNKERPELFRVHPSFIELVKEIQLERILRKKETVKTRISLWKITRAIRNMIEVNNSLKESLIEVEFNGR